MLYIHKLSTHHSKPLLSQLIFLSLFHLLVSLSLSLSDLFPILCGPLFQEFQNSENNSNQDNKPVRGSTDAFNSILATSSTYNEALEQEAHGEGHMEIKDVLDKVRLNYFSLNFTPDAVEKQYRRDQQNETLKKGRPFYLALAFGHLAFCTLNALGVFQVSLPPPLSLSLSLSVTRSTLVINNSFVFYVLTCPGHDHADTQVRGFDASEEVDDVWGVSPNAFLIMFYALAALIFFLLYIFAGSDYMRIEGNYRKDRNNMCCGGIL